MLGVMDFKNTFYCKFTRESASERNLKIGQDFVSLFMEHGVE